MFLKKPWKAWLTILLVLCALGGVWMWSTYHQTMASYQDSALEKARIVEGLLSRQDLALLTGTLEDLDRQGYRDLKASLENLVQVDRDLRFAYLYREKEGKLVFFGGL